METNRVYCFRRDMCGSLVFMKICLLTGSLKYLAKQKLIKMSATSIQTFSLSYTPFPVESAPREYKREAYNIM